MELNNSHLTNKRARMNARKAILNELKKQYSYVDPHDGRTKIAAGISRGALKNMAAAIVMKAAKNVQATKGDAVGR